MLEIRNVCAGYGDATILRDVSLQVPTGEVSTVLGSNGVGKTTMLKAIMGILPAMSGEILWRGTPLHTNPIWSRSQNGIGYVPQGREIFPFLSVHENLVLGLEAKGVNKPRIRQAADRIYERFPVLNRAFR